MDSIEKLAKFQAEMLSAEPADEDAARLQQMATLAVPLVGSMLPDDPALVDDYLLKLSAWALLQRSDDAQLQAAVVVKEEGGDWASLPIAVEAPPADAETVEGEPDA